MKEDAEDLNLLQQALKGLQMIFEEKLKMSFEWTSNLCDGAGDCEKRLRSFSYSCELIGVFDMQWINTQEWYNVNVLVSEDTVELRLLCPDCFEQFKEMQDKEVPIKE